jgi:hypothetical protein
VEELSGRMPVKSEFIDTQQQLGYDILKITGVFVLFGKNSVQKKCSDK